MADKLTVRDRVERQIVSVLEAARDAWITQEMSEGRWSSGEFEMNVRQWDDAGDDEATPLYDLVVISGDDTVAEESIGGTSDGPIATLQVPISVILYWAKRGDGRQLAQIHNLWRGRMIEAVMADRTLEEDETSERLAVDVAYQGSGNPELTEEGRQGEFATVVVFDVVYQEYADNPFSGPGLSEQTN